MRKQTQNRSFKKFAAIALGLAWINSAAFAESQDKLFVKTDTRNRVGSDDSLKHSTAFAMNALMDLGNLNIPAAVNNGMTAYGKYRNSETLDRLGDENLRRAAALSSIGSGAASTDIKKTDTTFRRLDPGFLREGKFGKVAAEFEKKSGMPRETFLSQLSEISEKKISSSDPQLVGKVIGRFESFISKVPNADFKANLQKGVEMVPASTRTGLIAKAVAKFAGGGAIAAGGDSSTISAPTTNAAAAEPAAAAPADAAPVVAAAESAAPSSSLSDDNRTPASAVGNLDASIPAGAEGEDKNNPLGNIIQAAIDTQGQDITIFQQITRRYRIVTPQLVK